MFVRNVDCAHATARSKLNFHIRLLYRSVILIPFSFRPSPSTVFIHFHVILCISLHDFASHNNEKQTTTQRSSPERIRRSKQFFRERVFSIAPPKLFQSLLGVFHRHSVFFAMAKNQDRVVGQTVNYHAGYFVRMRLRDPHWF